MKKHYETHVEDTDKLISVAGPVLDYKSWYEQYRKLMEEQAQRKYGLYTPTSEGDDDFPSIPGMIARYSALSLTNEQMAENPVWKDLTGNGYDLQMKNFAWSGMSGVGGYEYNFLSSDWAVSKVQLSEALSYKITIVDKKSSVQLFKYIRNESENTIKITLKVTGIEINGCTFRVYDNASMSHAQNYKKDGIYQINYTATEGSNRIYFYVSGGNMGQLDNPITIEQFPLYPGFILGDGVDDFAVTENNLDLEDTYTIYTPLILLKYGGVVCGKNSDKDFSLNTVISSKSIGFDSANAWSGSIPVDLFEFVLVACKRSPQTMYVKDLVTGKSNQNKSKEFVPNPRKYFVWRNVGGSWCQVAIAGQIICNGYYSTDEDDEKVLDWYKKQYPWLFPDQAWTVVGKTNEDEDRATIANITGNGNDLILSNFGFAEGSGYNEEGEYAGYLVTDGVDDKIVSSSFGMGKDFTIVGDWKFIDNKKSGTGLVKGSSFYIYNTMIGLDLYINSGSVKNSLDGIKSINAACSDGRAYDRNWNEILANTGNVVGSGGMLEVSSSGGRFDRIAFNNLAIYPRILSKDDCIKAYNYLQTLKSK